jgi:hypothetical protein
MSVVLSLLSTQAHGHEHVRLLVLLSQQQQYREALY